MGPQQQYNYPYDYNQNQNLSPIDPDKRMLKKLMLLLVLLVVVIIFFIAASVAKNNRTTSTTVGNKTYVTKSSQAPGTMKISSSGIPDTDSLVMTLNNSPLSPASLVSSGSFSKNLPSGNYTLAISKTGYTPFSAQFTITPGRTTIIIVNLVPDVNTTLSSFSQIQDATDPVEWDGPQPANKPTVNVTNIQYFYNKTWAFVTTYDGSSYGYLVAKFDFSTNTWESIAESNQYFSSSYLSEMPSQVSSYLTNNNYTYSGVSSSGNG